nr:MAG TPA: hypothetical protein [Bacteriophage sp.]
MINIIYFLLNNLIPNRIPNKDFKKCRRLTAFSSF